MRSDLNSFFLLLHLGLFSDKLRKRQKQSLPPHLVSVATIPCEMWMFNRAPLQQLFRTKTTEIVICSNHARRSLSTVGGTQWPINPPLLSSSHSPSFPTPRGTYGVKSHSRCGTEPWTELELAFHLTVTFLIKLQFTGSQRLLALVG